MISPSIFYSIQALNRLDNAHPHWGGQTVFCVHQSKYYSHLETPPQTETPRNNVSSGHQWPTQRQQNELSHHVKTHSEEGLVMMEQTPEWQATRLGAPRTARATGSWEEPSKSLALLTPCFQISRIQNWKRIMFCCFKPLSLWYFGRANVGH